MAKFRSCRAATNTGLLILVGVLAVAAIGFWSYRWLSAPKLQLASEDEVQYPKICTACKYEFGVPKKQATTWPQAESGYECPQCKKMTGRTNKKNVMTPTVLGGG